MLCSDHKAILFDLDTLDQLKIMNINTDVEGKDDLQFEIPLISKHVIPDTNCKFMLECYDSQFIRLRTVDTGSR